MAPPKRVTRYANHPIVKYVRSLPEEYYTGREVADLVDCTVAFLDYLGRHPTNPIGPTHQAQYGAITLHLYTPDRVDEIAKYMKAATKDRKRRGPTILWTKTEAQLRRRDLDKARSFRRRAGEYREMGEAEKAIDMEHRAKVLAEKLEKARVERYRKVHGRRKK